MSIRPAFISSYRARCKYCGDLPSHFTTLIGIPYHQVWNPRGTSRGEWDYDGLRDRDDNEYDYEKLMRENGIRGVCSFSTFVLKNFKDDFGSYRIGISCNCGQSIWMYHGPTDNPHLLNRKVLVFLYDHYKYRRRLPGANLG